MADMARFFDADLRRALAEGDIAPLSMHTGSIDNINPGKWESALVTVSLSLKCVLEQGRTSPE